MEILSVVGDASALRITTTGGIYDLNSKEMWLVRRIDPAVNQVNPRPVAKMVFEQSLGPLSVSSASKRACVVTSGRLTFDFRSDCLVLITCRDERTAYKFESLIVDPPWAKGHGGERMWTDGYGGSMHAANPNGPRPRVSEVSPNGMKVELKPGAGSAVAVFPPKLFDYERLYGRRARPHVYYAGNRDDQLSATLQRLDELAAERFGVIMLFAGHYDGAETGEVIRAERPVFDGGRYVYRYRRPESIRKFVRAVHADGFKVITYIAGGKFGRKQDQGTTLAFMREFQAEYRLDGWYFDHAGGGKNWLESYNFVRQVREDVGPAGVLIHHDSVDIWGGWDGRVLVPLDAYMDYTVKGETGPLAAQVHGPNNPFMRYYVSGYGMSQALGSHKICTSGSAAITLEETYRVRAANLLGEARVPFWAYEKWKRAFQPTYEARRRAYLAGRLRPDVDWPAEWFAEVSGLRATATGPRSAEIVWSTPVPADSEVRYALREGGGLSGSADTSKRSLDALAVRSHRIRLRGLERGTEYQFAVRSRTRGREGGERVWGGVGTFRTAARP
jgi:hypothetical protein